MKVSDFLNLLAAKTGKTTDLEAVLSNAALATVEMDDTIANELNGALLTMDGAKNNAGLKTHFNTLALNGVDAEIHSALEVLGFDDAVKTELLGEKNTYSKHRKLTAKMKETFDALKAAAQKDDSKATEKYAAQINKLQSELSTLKESHVPKSEIEALKKQHGEELISYMVKNTLASKKFVNEAFGADTNVELANVLLQKALSEKGIVLVKDASGLKLKQAADNALDYYDESQKAVAFNDFVDKTLANAKILAVSDPQKPPVQIPQPARTVQTPGNPVVYDNSAVVNQYTGALRD